MRTQRTNVRSSSPNSILQGLTVLRLATAEMMHSKPQARPNSNNYWQMGNVSANSTTLMTSKTESVDDMYHYDFHAVVVMICDAEAANQPLPLFVQRARRLLHVCVRHGLFIAIPSRSTDIETPLHFSPCPLLHFSPCPLLPNWPNRHSFHLQKIFVPNTLAKHTNFQCHTRDSLLELALLPSNQ